MQQTAMMQPPIDYQRTLYGTRSRLIGSMRNFLVLISFAFSAVAAQKIDIQGEVVTSNRAGAPIVVRLLKGTTPVQQMLADDRGKFKFRKVDPGSYVIHAECDGYYSQDVPVVVSDSTHPVSIS